ncbi:uncharacterized protein TM35_000272370, partial [Trypanosoma theileri]
TLLSFLFRIKSSNKETIPFLSIMQKNVNTNKGSPGEVHHLPSFPLQALEKTTAREATVQQTTHTFVSAFRQYYSSPHHHQSAIKKNNNTDYSQNININFIFLFFASHPVCKKTQPK